MPTISHAPISIACIGEAMIELALDRLDPALGRVGFAGDTLNTAIYLKRAGGMAVDVSYISVLGSDPFSARLRNMIASEAIATDCIGTAPERMPGLYSISTDEKGERSFHYWRENSAARTLFQPGSGTSLDDLGRFEVVYLSAITLAILPESIRSALLDRLALLRAKGTVKVAFDSNWRPRLWQDIATARTVISRAWSLADIALPSLDDEMALFGENSQQQVLARFAGICPGIGALKRGAAGPLPLGAQGLQGRYASIEKPLDTTAAGDSFNGAFLAAHLRGKPLADAMQDGHAYASCVVMHPGAIIPADVLPAVD